MSTRLKVIKDYTLVVATAIQRAYFRLPAGYQALLRSSMRLIILYRLV